jgi:antirestriction protein ArdC
MSLRSDGYEPEPIAMPPENERFVHADAFVEALKIPVVVGAYDAHYRIDLDQIFMPPHSAFESPAAHAGTLIHEAAPATGAKHRLDRNFQKRFRRDWLAIEEATPDWKKPVAKKE